MATRSTLSMIVHRQNEHRGRAIYIRLKDLVPRQMFKVASGDRQKVIAMNFGAPRM